MHLSHSKFFMDILGIPQEIPQVLDVPLFRACLRAREANVREGSVQSFLARSWPGIHNRWNHRTVHRPDALEIRLLIHGFR